MEFLRFASQRCVYLDPPNRHHGQPLDFHYHLLVVPFAIRTTTTCCLEAICGPAAWAAEVSIGWSSAESLNLHCVDAGYLSTRHSMRVTTSLTLGLTRQMALTTDCINPDASL